MATAAKDFYRVLGLARDASPLSIERAYRDLLAELADEVELWGASEEIDRVRVEAAEAYQVLRNPESRRAYDGLRGAASWWSDFIEDDFVQEPAEGYVSEAGFLEAVMRRLVAAGAAGHEETVELMLPFEVAALGGRARLRIPTRNACPECVGTGAAEGGAAFSCPTCLGRAGDTACARCGGRGWQVSSECRRCRGEGWTFGIGFVSLTIPSGVSDGALLPFPGLDEQQVSLHPRYVRVKVSRHPFFSRRGKDVYCRVPVSEKDAREGSTVVVRTLRGRQQRVTIPPETKSGTVVRLVGEGIELDGQRGDQLVEIRVKLHARRKSGGSA